MSADFADQGEVGRGQLECGIRLSYPLDEQLDPGVACWILRDLTSRGQWERGDRQLVLGMNLQPRPAGNHDAGLPACGNQSRDFGGRAKQMLEVIDDKE
jgi:hypothetical protein